MTDPLIALAEAAGLQPVYQDAWGAPHAVSRETLSAMLAALGLGGDPAAALDAHRRQVGGNLLPPVIVLRHGTAARAEVMLPIGQEDVAIAWRVQFEAGGEAAESSLVQDLDLCKRVDLPGVVPYEHRALPLPEELPPGYHCLTVEFCGMVETAPLIVAPARAWQDWRGGDDRRWGFSVQLYAVRSARNWGIGDLTDLRRLLERAAERGAAMVGINPLHTLYPDEPEAASPYSPSTRLFGNPLYLDIEAVPEFQSCAAAQTLAASDGYRDALRSLRAAPQVRYREVAALKQLIFPLLHRQFETASSPERRAAFERFRAERGPALRRLAIFECLRAVRGEADPAQRDWRNWPAALRDPDSAAVAAFAAEYPAAVGCAEYLQWQFDEQLGACGRHAEALGLSIGIFGDLAVGVAAAGAEAWWNQNVQVPGFSVGAPPDILNTQGQGWGFPLFHPARLAAEAYEPFIAVLRANMRHAGALRIDHALGLMRLWCVPPQGDPREGVYLDCPAADLVALIILESHRNRCLVIGEDLGTLPPGLDRLLSEAGILSYRVLYFEQEHGYFRPAAAYKPDALVTLGTHDLPPLPRWWAGDDLALRTALGHLAPEALDAAQAQRRHERDALAGWAGAEPGDTPPVVALHRTLARTPARLLCAQLEDMRPEAAQMNVPGTSDEYPNWRHRLAGDIATLFADPLVDETFRAIAAERPARR